MKCTDNFKKKLLSLFLLSFIVFTGCEAKDQGSYDIYETTSQYGITKNISTVSSHFFSSDICLADDTNIGVEQIADSQVAQGAGAFNTKTQQTIYAQNIHTRLYPASTTKILTAYVALKYGNLDQNITVSAHATDQASDSSVCHLNAGDVLTLRQLLYGLMMRSGNDAAVAIAEGVSGDEESFVQLMNQEALALGATNSHFVTSNGLHDENHYTTVYDMYLIFNEAIKNPNFVDILSTVNYTVNYTGSDGAAKSQSWSTTNQYLLGHEKAPSNITVIGGKTGTTGQAGYCLVLLSRNSTNDLIISIVFDADCRSNLYYLMTQILYQFAN